MNTKDGYAKKSLTSARLLTADGGDIPQSTFAEAAHSHDSQYLKLTGGTLTGPLSTTALNVAGPATFQQIINGSILGNATTATRLQNTIDVQLTGAINSSATSFNGASNLTINCYPNSSYDWTQFLANQLNINQLPISWADESSPSMGQVIPTLTYREGIYLDDLESIGTEPQYLYIPKKSSYVAFPVIQDKNGNLFVALPLRVGDDAITDGWTECPINVENNE